MWGALRLHDGSLWLLLAFLAILVGAMIGLFAKRGGGISHPAALRLPGGIEACLFDLDGVLTDTARIHAEAWARTFDAFLADRHEPVRPRR